MSLFWLFDKYFYQKLYKTQKAPPPAGVSGERGRCYASRAKEATRRRGMAYASMISAVSSVAKPNFWARTSASILVVR